MRHTEKRKYRKEINVVNWMKRTKIWHNHILRMSEDRSALKRKNEELIGKRQKVKNVFLRRFN